MTQQVAHIVLLVVLLGFSAFFSGCETTFFALSRRQVKLFSQSTHRLPRLVSVIMRRPGQLLGCLLFGNMTVNVLFFAASSVLAIDIGRRYGVTAGTVTGVVNFLLLVLLGEILPKSAAYINTRPIAVAMAVPTYLCVRVFSPIVSLFRFFIEKPTLRLILGAAHQRKPITNIELKQLIEHARKGGLITADENRFLTETVELGLLKVRHVMCPRVDMAACEIMEKPAHSAELMMKKRITKMPVYAGRIDNIVGVVELRDIMLQPGTALEKLVRKVHFVPEQKRVESLVEFFRKARTDIAIVVDEYGGIAGTVRIEDVAEELMGPMKTVEQGREIEAIGPLKYRLAGHLPIHDWAEAFGVDVEETQVSTIGGLVTELLGRIPKPGDETRLNNLKFTVEKVRKNRVETVVLNLEPLRKNGR